MYRHRGTLVIRKGDAELKAKTMLISSLTWENDFNEALLQGVAELGSSVGNTRFNLCTSNTNCFKSGWYEEKSQGNLGLSESEATNRLLIDIVRLARYYTVVSAYAKHICTEPVTGFCKANVKATQAMLTAYSRQLESLGYSVEYEYTYFYADPCFVKIKTALGMKIVYDEESNSNNNYTGKMVVRVLDAGNAANICSYFVSVDKEKWLQLTEQEKLTIAELIVKVVHISAILVSQDGYLCLDLIAGIDEYNQTIASLREEASSEETSMLEALQQTSTQSNGEQAFKVFKAVFISELNCDIRLEFVVCAKSNDDAVRYLQETQELEHMKVFWIGEMLCDDYKVLQAKEVLI